MRFCAPSLHYLSLWHFYFADLFELEECLGGCPSLKSLTMYNLFLKEGMDLAQRAKERQALGPPRILLDTLQLVHFKEELMQALLDAFTVIAIAHLRWLSLRCTKIDPLLQANAATIQRLEIISIFDEAQLEPYLRAHLRICTPCRLLSFGYCGGLPELNVLHRKLGHLRQVNNLRTVSVEASQPISPAGWQELDTLLDDAPALAEVNVYSGSEGHPDEPRPEFMPALAARGVLRIRGFSTGPSYITDLPPR
ncbi:hypothetical protein C8R47DRAFT_1148807 [Mycena vitilis]|nr:hypothetical protein C8R47DRAFT_1148807 [Mycena vitilis]